MKEKSLPSEEGYSTQTQGERKRKEGKTGHEDHDRDMYTYVPEERKKGQIERKERKDSEAVQLQTGKTESKEVRLRQSFGTHEHRVKGGDDRGGDRQRELGNNYRRMTEKRANRMEGEVGHEKGRE